MKLQSPTLILVCAAIALGSFVAVTELRSTDSGEDGESQSLFTFEEEEVRSLVVETAVQTLMFEKGEMSNDEADLDSSESANSSGDEDASERDGDSEDGDEPSEGSETPADAAFNSPEEAGDTPEEAGDTSEEEAEDTPDSSEEEGADSDADAEGSDADGAEDEEEEEVGEGNEEGGDALLPEWWMRSPDDAPADDAAVIFLVNLMASGVSDRVFDVAPENLDDFGFETPLAEVEVTLENDESHRLILGNYDFNGTNIYAQTVSMEPDNGDNGAEDAESETVEVFIVSTSFEAAVNRPIDEWKQSAISDEQVDDKEASTDQEEQENADSDKVSEDEPSS